MASKFSVLFSMLFLFSLSQLQAESKTSLPVKIIAHRGASADAPENTLNAFQLAFAQQSDGIELDVQVSKDGHFVVLHDLNLFRTAGTHALVHELTLAELKKFEVGSWKNSKFLGEEIPLLKQVFDMMPSDKYIFVELKAVPADKLSSLDELLKTYRVKLPKMIIISFDHDVLDKLKSIDPSLKAFYLTEYKTCFEPKQVKPSSCVTDLPSLKKLIVRAKQNHIEGFDLEYSKFFNSEVIAELKGSGLESAVWSYEADDHLQALKDVVKAGADFFTTNHPLAVRKKYENMQAK